ncbi:nucleotide exchange factor GrpE [Streptosporangium sp. NBC_01755]|uniref:nucleotide exchange factor GrpE n=1 Tax=unclassified Streptosporangium TaxID=2632669 RepID=UPI002DDBE8EB|nr:MULTISPECIES: nucleotide exchange factor GrpE [unclassified Streptosporangium]WSA29154.1 nucleotide exchange factor GrpE [Streptosporangium sp. NBC_01810]WSC99401.1 nucleotide exchange factor GrpE [Streptosporangium sp. NBC_01755]
MRDRRVFLPLLLLAWPALTGCGAVAGLRGETATASSAPLRGDGVGSLRPGEAGSVTVGTPIGLLPLPLVLAVAAGTLAAAAAGLYLWHRNRRPAPAQAPVPGTWQAAPYGTPRPGTAPQGTVPFPVGEAGSTPVRPVAGRTGPPAEPPTGPPAGPPADPLSEALAQVSGSGISPALTQQVERLFSEGHPGREALVGACVGYRDQLAERHPRLAGTLLEALNRAGVQEIVADGQRFDPRLHEAFGTAPAGSPELHDIVAETVRRGYADGGHVIRVPQVVVYRHVSPGPGAER